MTDLYGILTPYIFRLNGPNLNISFDFISKLLEDNNPAL